MPPVEVCVTKQMIRDRAELCGRRLTEEEAAEVVRNIVATLTPHTSLDTTFVDEHIRYLVGRSR